MERERERERESVMVQIWWMERKIRSGRTSVMDCERELEREREYVYKTEGEKESAGERMREIKR
jgi:hypothetical protein